MFCSYLFVFVYLIVLVYIGWMFIVLVLVLWMFDELMDFEVVYCFIYDELMFDGSLWLNLVIFVIIWMDLEVEKLMVEMFDKNMIDKDEYLVIVVIEVCCVFMVVDLFYVEGLCDYDFISVIGVFIIGFSEVVMLGGLVLKWCWW